MALPAQKKDHSLNMLEVSRRASSSASATFCNSIFVLFTQHNVLMSSSLADRKAQLTAEETKFVLSHEVKIHPAYFTEFKTYALQMLHYQPFY